MVIIIIRNSNISVRFFMIKSSYSNTIKKVKNFTKQEYRPLTGNKPS